VEDIGRGTLKCVSASSPHRSLRSAIEGALREHVAAHNVRHLHDSVFAVHTEAEPSDIRDWLAPLLREDESLLVVEFERWSGHGGAIDRRWLLRRGH
jgi:hypothetical protein